MVGAIGFLPFFCFFWRIFLPRFFFIMSWSANVPPHPNLSCFIYETPNHPKQFHILRTPLTYFCFFRFLLALFCVCNWWSIYLLFSFSFLLILVSGNRSPVHFLFEQSPPSLNFRGHLVLLGFVVPPFQYLSFFPMARSPLFLRFPHFLSLNGPADRLARHQITAVSFS